MEINGIAHIFISVTDFEACRDFYRELLAQLGLRPVIDTEGMLYCVGGRTAFGVRPCDPEHAGVPFDQTRAGLHHVCFRARSRAAVDALHAWLQGDDGRVVHAPEEGPWAPGYYSLLFEDPGGTRLEINHVPGTGLLKKSQE